MLVLSLETGGWLEDRDDEGIKDDWDDGGSEELEGPAQSLMRWTVYTVAHGGGNGSHFPGVQLNVLWVVAAGSGHPQCAVRVERIARIGKVQVVGHAVVVSVTVGQAGRGVMAVADA